jgi:hypothetical protein
MQEGRLHSTGVAFSAVENDEVPGPSPFYCTHLHLRHLCCNPATCSLLEHCGDIVSCPEKEEAVVGGRREHSEIEREREKSDQLRRVLGSKLMVEKCLFALSVNLKTYPISRPVAARAQRHSVQEGGWE